MIDVDMANGLTTTHDSPCLSSSSSKTTAPSPQTRRLSRRPSERVSSARATASQKRPASTASSPCATDSYPVATIESFELTENEHSALQLIAPIIREAKLRANVGYAEYLNQRQYDTETAQQLWRHLVVGVNVMKYQRSGNKPVLRRIRLRSSGNGSTMYFMCDKGSRLRRNNSGIALHDVAEIRKGCSSFVFRQCCVDADSACCLTIVGTRRCFDVSFAAQSVRDAFADRLNCFINTQRHTAAHTLWSHAFSVARKKLNWLQLSKTLLFKQSMQRGLYLRKHVTMGSPRMRVLWLDATDMRLYIDADRRISSLGTGTATDNVITTYNNNTNNSVAFREGS